MFDRPTADTTTDPSPVAAVKPALRLAASIEIAPGQIERQPDVLKHIPPATRTYIVDLGTKSPNEWAELCRLLVNNGLEPVPHIAARRLSGSAELRDRLTAMSEQAGVRDVLLIAGEGNPTAPAFDSSMAVLETGLLDACGIKRVAVAGHPEGNPAMTDATAEAAITWKQDFASRTGADMRVVTQFGFQVEAATKWAAGLQSAGVDLPVHLGIAGPASVTSLLKFAAMCGVRASSQFLAKKGAAVTSLMTNHSPEQYVAPVEEHVAAHTACLIKQFHVFPFGGIARASEWLCERGSWNGDARAVFERNGSPRDLGSTGITPQKFG
ncbi:MAG: methylenetetrahydrofolate reductase [Hyphomicrobiaceae bacterium]